MIQAEENTQVQKSEERLLVYNVCCAKGQCLITESFLLVVTGSHWINTLCVQFAAQLQITMQSSRNSMRKDNLILHSAGQVPHLELNSVWIASIFRFENPDSFPWRLISFASSPCQCNQAFLLWAWQAEKREGKMSCPAETKCRTEVLERKLILEGLCSLLRSQFG